MANRVVFLVDGFNLYHSVRDVMRHNPTWTGLRWLNIGELCRQTLPSFGKTAQLETVHYFTALAHHRVKQDKMTVVRHRTFIRALESTGVVVHEGRFKPKEVGCHVCGQKSIHYEEKETDVALGAALLEVLHRADCETVALLTGDTDLSPALEAAARLFPKAELAAVFPYGRAPNQLRQLVQYSVKLSREAYRGAVFPETITLANGKVLNRPVEWAGGHEPRNRSFLRRASWKPRRLLIRGLCSAIRRLR